MPRIVEGGAPVVNLRGLPACGRWTSTRGGSRMWQHTGGIMFGEASQQADLGTTILAILLSRWPYFVAQRGKMSSPESAAVAVQAHEGWRERQPPAQLQ